MLNRFFNIMRKQEGQNRIENRDWYLMTGLIWLGIGIRCFMWYWIEASYLGDLIHYVDVAKDIGDGYLMKALSATTPPLYPLLIHTVHLFIQDYDISARLVNVVFGVTFLTKSQAKLFFALTLIWVLVFLTIENKKIISRGIFGVLLLVIGYGIM